VSEREASAVKTESGGSANAGPPNVAAPLAGAPRRRALVGGIKVLGLCAFVAFLLRRPELLEGAWQSLRTTNLAWWGASVAVLFFTLWINALRTRAILRAGGFEIPLRSLYADVIQAAGLNAVLLIGVDVLYRAERMRPVVGSFERGFAVALLDRIFGFAAMFVAGLVGFVFLGTKLPFAFDGNKLAVLAAAGVVGVGVAAWLLPSRLRALWDRIRPAVEPLFRDRRRFAEVAVLSFFTYAGAVLAVFCLSRGLAHPAPLLAYASVVPIVTVATVLPVTVGGIGIREAGYVTLLGAYGVAQGPAIALGVTQYATFLVAAAVGGLLFLRGR
jgi:uncharacterized membrane protein YbhN (UPF0104 family)